MHRLLAAGAHQTWRSRNRKPARMRSLPSAERLKQYYVPFNHAHKHAPSSTHTHTHTHTHAYTNRSIGSYQAGRAPGSNIAPRAGFGWGVCFVFAFAPPHTPPPSRPPSSRLLTQNDGAHGRSALRSGSGWEECFGHTRPRVRAAYS